MNIDLIIKLAKLANNNPNENEANAASRKVCRLIAEGKYEFNNVKTSVSKINITSNPSSQSADWLKKYYTDPFNPSKSQKDYYENLKDLYYGIDFDFYQDVSWNEEEKKKKPRIKVKCCKCGFEVDRPLGSKTEGILCNICLGK